MKCSTAILTVTWLAGTLCLLNGAVQAQPYEMPPGAAYGLPPAAPYAYPSQACEYPSASCAPSPCRPILWADADLLIGIRKSRYFPELVTTSTAGTSQLDAGVLGLASTRLLFGGERVEGDVTTGARLELGTWLDAEANSGVGFAYFGYTPDTIRFSAASDGDVGSQIFARPIYNALLDAEGSQLVAYPGIVSGNVDVANENRIFGTEVFLRQRIGYRMSGDRWDLIAGYQFTEIDDTLRISNFLTSLDPTFLIGVGSTLDAFDSFRAYNVFHGGLLGVKYLKSNGPWSISMLGKVGLGAMRQTLVVNGRTIITAPDGTSFTQQSGLLVQDSNRGTYQRDRFAVVPEGRLNVTYRICPWMSAGVGYSFIYWNGVALAGEQVSRNVDVTQTVPAPTPQFRETDTFVHSVTFTLQCDF